MPLVMAAFSSYLTSFIIPLLCPFRFSTGGASSTTGVANKLSTYDPFLLSSSQKSMVVLASMLRPSIPTKHLASSSME